jgi:hypothetical protein
MVASACALAKVPLFPSTPVVEADTKLAWLAMLPVSWFNPSTPLCWRTEFNSEELYRASLSSYVFPRFVTLAMA